ncbi:flagellar motor switch protein FliN [Rhodohalobacter sp. SW132]|uniref:flagellar motor switch protein FliN n=1 Tax=Rhodohalobacter sp. SW132 TaxID=2293433 RepID=UPI000E274AAD|nr:flagellar motor switch protein FliN [Rhodohalobacter sp. SW132]REL38671.1 flagellar motor switch protein FliN [Rhodohalobacter sp. SW132]
MENWKEEFQKYLPDVEKFLTSVLLEETHIEIVSSEVLEKQSVLDTAQKTDIFLFTRDQENNADCLIVLEEEWYGLLSSIMLGVEEKKNNEITRDLLKKFSSELSATLIKRIEQNGQKAEPGEMQVLTHPQVEKLLAHTEYFFAKMEIEGVADENVRAAFLVGNPEAIEAEEEPEAEEEAPKQEESAKADKKAPAEKPDPLEKDFSPVEAKEMEEIGSMEDVISGSHIEFEDFDESSNGNGHHNGDSRSMDLLKDVEMDVSVELGRIELPLGKVLQLAKGSVIELEKLAGEPVDILVNGHCIAQGEVVVIDEHFGVRIANLVTTRQRIAKLQ